MPESSRRKDYYTVFAQLPIGQVIGIPFSCLTPTQPDDKVPSLTKGPIEACYYDSGQILIIHGHHRYYSLQRRCHGNQKLQVRKITNPYLDIAA